VYLHGENVIHRDIKAGNCLTDKDGNVKLADFGVAVIVESKTKISGNIIGSPYWLAPEVILYLAPTFKSDIWSLGCTLIEFLTGSPPYFDLTAMAAMYKIGESEEPPPLPETKMSDDLKDFLLKCLEREPDKRPSAKELLLHNLMLNNERKVTRTNSRGSLQLKVQKKEQLIAL